MGAAAIFLFVGNKNNLAAVSENHRIFLTWPNTLNCLIFAGGVIFAIFTISCYSTNKTLHGILSIYTLYNVNVNQLDCKLTDSEYVQFENKVLQWTWCNKSHWSEYLYVCTYGLILLCIMLGYGKMVSLLIILLKLVQIWSETKVLGTEKSLTYKYNIDLFRYTFILKKYTLITKCIYIRWPNA